MPYEENTSVIHTSHATFPPGQVRASASFIVVAVFLILIGCEAEKEAKAPAPPDVMVAGVKQQDVPIYQEWVGTLEGEVNATITAQVSGYLISQTYREGSVVTKGQVLFQIDPAPFDAILARSKAQLEAAVAIQGKTELDVKRYTPLAASQAISQQELDNAIQQNKAADGQVTSAKAAVQSAELNLAFTTIRSPVDGVAGLAQAQIGNLIGPSSGALTTVSQIDPIRAYFSISQQLMTKLTEAIVSEGKQFRTGEGPSLELILATGSTYPNKGMVRFTNNQVNVKTGTIQVVGIFPNPQQVLVPGMFTRVRALLNTEKNALLVPQRAVTEMQGRYLIAIVGGDDKVSIRPVTVGERIGQDWMIQGNVKPGDRVVAEGIQKVREGMVVHPMPMAAPTDVKPGVKAAEPKP